MQLLALVSKLSLNVGVDIAPGADLGFVLQLRGKGWGFGWRWRPGATMRLLLPAVLASGSFATVVSIDPLFVPLCWESKQDGEGERDTNIREVGGENSENSLQTYTSCVPVGHSPLLSSYRIPIASQLIRSSSSRSTALGVCIQPAGLPFQVRALLLPGSFS